MNNTKPINVHNDQESFKGAVLRTLVYFDIFNYPLTADEIHSFSQERGLPQGEHLYKLLQDMVDDRLIFNVNDFYLLQDDSTLVKRRLEGNERASNMLKVAGKVSRFISCFPFVRAVMLSGSISKGYMDKNSDIDFFIITAPGMLWFTRTMLVLFKRIFLFNSHKYFCVNYFIDTENLEIEEKNIYTAIECITLIPIIGENYYRDFLQSNSWTKEYFPNINAARQLEHIQRSRKNIPKYLFENFFTNRAGTFLDRYFMKLTYKRWRKLFSNQFSKDDFDVAFKTKKYASKNHPKFYQKKILDMYSRKIKVFEKDNNVYLTRKQA